MSFWSKNPTRRGALASAVKDVFKLSPVRLFWRVLEATARNKNKPYILFVLPYNEYCENTRYLFEFFMTSNDRILKPLLFVYDQALFAKLAPLYPDNVVLARSRQGFRAFCGASVAVTSRGSMQRLFLPYAFIRGRKTFVNLWHGIPLKRLGSQAKDTWETIVTYGIQDFDVWIASSDVEGLALASCYGLSLDDIWIVGTPRNDALFAAGRERARTGVRTILYAPTWRDGSQDARFLPFDDLDMNALEEFLRRTDSRLVMRRHLVERLSSSPATEVSSRILEDDGSLYTSTRDLLMETDVLVTDYSSIYLDYIVLNRPIVFVPYDLAEYEKKRGFLFDYHEVTPGPKVGTFQEFLQALEDAISRPEAYAAERRRVTDRFHKHQDGEACRRLARLLHESA